jgi:hypothetical protein
LQGNAQISVKPKPIKATASPRDLPGDGSTGNPVTSIERAYITSASQWQSENPYKLNGESCFTECLSELRGMFERARARGEFSSHTEAMALIFDLL